MKLKKAHSIAWVSVGSSRSQLWTFQRTSHVNYTDERPAGLLSRREATKPTHHRKVAVALYSWRWTYRCPKHVEIFMIKNHNCCINLVPLVILIYDARSHIRVHQIQLYAPWWWIAYDPKHVGV